MNANFQLLPEAVAVISAESKADILAKVAEKFAAVYGGESDAILEALEEREALGSTGFGRGVAIPHARVNTIHRPQAVLLKLVSPVDFNAADGMDVELVFGLLSPAQAGATHLHALAAISRLVRDDDVQEALMQADNAEALYSVFANNPERKIA